MSYKYTSTPMHNVLSQNLAPAQIPAFLNFTGLSRSPIATSSGPIWLVGDLHVTANDPSEFFNQTVIFRPAASNGSSATISGAARLVDGAGTTLWTSSFPTAPRLLHDMFTFDAKGNITAWQINQAGPPELGSFSSTGDSFAYGITIRKSDAPGVWAVVPLPAGIWLMLAGIMALYGARRKTLRRA